MPARATIKNYGKRLAYKFAYNEGDNFFGIAAHFGQGLFLWALAARHDFEISSEDMSEIWLVGSPWVSNHAAAILEGCR